MSTLRLVVGVDGSPAGSRALEWALRQEGAEILVVTAFDPEGSAVWAARRRKDSARRQHEVLTAGLAAVPGATGVRSMVVPGVAARVLADSSAEADLLVVGSHGHGPVEARLLGTVTSDCIRWSACPVVVIPAPADGPGPTREARSLERASGPAEAAG